MNQEDLKVGMKVLYRDELWEVVDPKFIANFSDLKTKDFSVKLRRKKEQIVTKAHCLSPASTKFMRSKETMVANHGKRETYEDVLIRVLLAHPGFSDEIDTHTQLAVWMEECRGTCATVDKFAHNSWSAQLSTLQTAGIVESRSGRWFLCADWEAKRAARNSAIEAEKDKIEAMKQSLAPRLKSFMKDPEVQAAVLEIDSAVEMAKEGGGGNEISVRDTHFRERVYKKWGNRAWFTGETVDGSVHALHTIDVVFYRAARMSRIDDSEYNGHPGSPSLNYWELHNLVRMVPTAHGVKLEVLCDDPILKQYDGIEEIIDNSFDRLQVHDRIAFRNEHAELVSRL